MMSKLIFVAMLLLAFPLNAQVVKEDWELNPLVENIPIADLIRLRALRQQIINTGCDPNLCFVLEDDASLTDAEFQEQKDFTDLIVAITTTDEPANFCAVTYDTGFKSIVPLTKFKEYFLDTVQEVSQGNRYVVPDLIPGLGYAVKQLRRQRQDANNIIFYSKQVPRDRRIPHYFKQFIDLGNAISAVAFNKKNAPALAKYTRDINRVVPISDGFFAISETIVAVVADVCNTNCNALPLPSGNGRRRGPRCPKKLGETVFKNFDNTFGEGTVPRRPTKKPRRGRN